VRVRIVDPTGKQKQVKETAPITDGGSNPRWNEYLKFEGIEDPALCSVYLEIRDRSDAKDEPARGVAKVNLGVLGATCGFQQFRDIITDSWFSDVDLSFGLNNFGTWGNSARVENTLSLKMMGAGGLEDMDTGVGGLFADENDPYVYIELVDENDNAIAEPRQTQVVWEGGTTVEWNETFEFSDLLLPSAYKLKLSVWEKDILKEDDDLGKMEFALGRCFRVAEPMLFEEALDVGSARLKFSICTGGAWGALTKEMMKKEPLAEWVGPAPPGHYMKCKILSATGLARTADPICRLTLRDEWGKTIKTVSTKVNAKAKANAEKGWKGDVHWDEGFMFADVVNPCLCTLSVSVFDAGGLSLKSLGETTLPLGTLAAKPGLQPIVADIAGDSWSSKVKLAIDNFGSWGNGQPEENKLYMMIKGAVGLPTHVGTLIRSEAGPYIHVDLKGPDGTVLQSKSTMPKTDAGSDPRWDEELVFDNIERPAACSLFIRCYKGSVAEDQKLVCCGAAVPELPCGVLSCSSEYTAFYGTTLGGTCKLDFCMHTGGTWGNKVPRQEPKDVAGGVKRFVSKASLLAAVGSKASLLAKESLFGAGAVSASLLGKSRRRAS
jgi:hypothetical protein